MKYPRFHDVKTGPITYCQICGGKKLHTVLDLGHQPLCDSLLTREMLKGPEKTYPLRMVWCEECTGIQLDYCVDGKEVYHPNYPYRSGITKELADYQKNISSIMVKKYNLTGKDLVVDVGSNDGTLLAGFKEQGVKVVGVEPTNIADIARKNGIPTVKEFFTNETARFIKKRFGPASLIITTNTFAHMQTVGEVILGAHTLLKPDGVFVSETHYLLDVIEKGQFDTIYHEHLRTYSLRSLVKLFEPYDFTVTDVERGDRYGGNIRVHVTKAKGKKVSVNVPALLKVEKQSGLSNKMTYMKFAWRARQARLKFMEFIVVMEKKGKYVVGNSCPGRSSTLLNYYGVNKDILPYIAEQPISLKLGMYLPGLHIPIVDNQLLIDDQPDYVVLLAWHLAKPIAEQLKARGLKSDFVVPLPDFKIIKNSSI